MNNSVWCFSYLLGLKITYIPVEVLQVELQFPDSQLHSLLLSYAMTTLACHAPARCAYLIPHAWS